MSRPTRRSHGCPTLPTPFVSILRIFLGHFFQKPRDRNRTRRGLEGTMASRGSEMKTVISGNEVSYELGWEFCPLRTDRGNASTSGSSPKGAASATGKKVTATIATSIPPGVRVSQSQSSGLYGGAYAVPSLTLIETERGEQPTLAPPTSPTRACILDQKFHSSPFSCR